MFHVAMLCTDSTEVTHFIFEPNVQVLGSIHSFVWRCNASESNVSQVGILAPSSFECHTNSFHHSAHFHGLQHYRSAATSTRHLQTFVRTSSIYHHKSLPVPEAILVVRQVLCTTTVNFSWSSQTKLSLFSLFLSPRIAPQYEHSRTRRSLPLLHRRLWLQDLAAELLPGPSHLDTSHSISALS